MPSKFYSLGRLITASFLLSVLTGASDGYSDFLKTSSSGVYQDPSGRVKVVLSHSPGSEGIFILVTDPISPQEFNLETLDAENKEHLFLGYSPENSENPFDEIRIGNRSYKINGNLTVDIKGVASLSIDNNNPYVTVNTKGDAVGSKPSILGFMGLTEVVNGGTSASAVLAANQLDEEAAKLIKPYTLRDHELKLDNKAVNSRSIGILIDPNRSKNRCMKGAALVLNSDQVEKIKSGKSEEDRVKIFSEISKEGQKSSAAKGLLYLKVTADSIIALNPVDQNIKEVHELKGIKDNNKIICVVQDLSSID